MATIYRINKREVTEKEFGRHAAAKAKKRGNEGGAPATNPTTGWPMESDAAGVHPEQVGEAMAHAVSQGVPTEFNRETGNPIFRSRQHRNDFLKAHGLKDKDAGYGDYAGQ